MLSCHFSPKLWDVIKDLLYVNGDYENPEKKIDLNAVRARKSIAMKTGRIGDNVDFIEEHDGRCLLFYPPEYRALRIPIPHMRGVFTGFIDFTGFLPIYGTWDQLRLDLGTVRIPGHGRAGCDLRARVCRLESE